jgi:HEAT repeat protein
MFQDPEDRHLRVFSIDSAGADDDAEAEEAPLEKPKVGAVLDMLEQGEVRPAILIGLSDLSADEVNLVRKRWADLPDETRVAVLRAVVEMTEDRVDFHFGRLLRLALVDDAAEVRQLAISGLWEDEGSDLPTLLGRLARGDESEDVRAQAAQGLARFVDMAETGKLDATTTSSIRRTLFDTATDENESWHVRRRALESAAAFGTDPRLIPLIEELYNEDELGLRATAIFAMGRTMAPRWLPMIINEFVSDDAEIRYEAARASGQLNDVEALPGLSELAKDEDLEVRLAAIASIGAIGGSAALRILRRLAEDAPDTDEDAIDDALIEAAIVTDPLSIDEPS